jgi:kinesin family protein C1
MKETLAINKSLTNLSIVITSLAKKESHVAYRNSKLTHLLQPYLQGDSKTLMLVNISPLRCNYHPSVCSLRFAQDVKKVRGNVSPIKK